MCSWGIVYFPAAQKDFHALDRTQQHQALKTSFKHTLEAGFTFNNKVKTGIDILKEFVYNNDRISLEEAGKMLIKSSTALRNDYDSLVKLSKENNEPIYITRNGEGEMIFLSIEDYEKREAELKLLEQLLTAERNRLAGSPTYTTGQVRAELEELYGQA